MNFLKIIKLMGARLKYLSEGHSATVEYPNVIRQAPQNARVGLRNDFSECIGCLKCEEICPVLCIDITSENFHTRDSAPKTTRGVVFESRVTSFKIDFNQCINCGLCVDICPTNSLSNDKVFVSPRQDSRHLKVDLVHRPRTLRRDQGYED
jgi:formate hydrogenlyase subunit 6/NADH:ubiquinone oxidoreductase subunit I